MDPIVLQKMLEPPPPLVIAEPSELLTRTLRERDELADLNRRFSAELSATSYQADQLAAERDEARADLLERDATIAELREHEKASAQTFDAYVAAANAEARRLEAEVGRLRHALALYRGEVKFHLVTSPDSIQPPSDE